MKSEMEQDILKVLVTEEELKARVAELGAAIYDRFQGKNPLCYEKKSPLSERQRVIPGFSSHGFSRFSEDLEALRYRNRTSNTICF